MTATQQNAHCTGMDEPQCGGPKEACLVVGCEECGTTAENLRALAIRLGEENDRLSAELAERTDDRDTTTVIGGREYQ